MSAVITIQDLQSIDVLMTDMVRAYQNNPDNFVADQAFPVQIVSVQAAKYYTFDNSIFRNRAKPRTFGDPVPRTSMTLSNDNYFCNQYATGKSLPREIAAEAGARGLPITNRVAESLAHYALLQREISFATDFMITSVWGTDNTTATDWDDTSGKPMDDVALARRTIRNASGMEANTMVCGAIVFDALQTNAQLLDAVKYTSRALSIDFTASVVANALQLDRVLVSRASYNSADEGEADNLGPILDDDALIIHVGPTSGAFATAGATFAWDAGGGLGTVDRNYDYNTKSDVADIVFAYDQKLVGSTLGYFFSDIV